VVANVILSGPCFFPLGFLCLWGKGLSGRYIVEGECEKKEMEGGGDSNDDNTAGYGAFFPQVKKPNQRYITRGSTAVIPIPILVLRIKSYKDTPRNTCQLRHLEVILELRLRIV
jgi:hypothetical protein